ncbi:class I SAM-dependent methyltransferase [Streptomyces sp. EN23]|uniref:class I SAM-dependent methyltransferase n=1 Tax=Streptomyces sp. EN23 TaxID=212774 RepID=UPI000851A5E4|nr:class I SAM-dependent methyltransferase [Streptomyces sp. EN23]
MQEADIKPAHRVLDVACATGNAALYAARRSASVTGLDFDPVMIEAARRRQSDLRMSVDFRIGDAARMPFADASFDCVLSTYGSTFAPDAEAAAQEMLRVCRPTGSIQMANWNPDGVITAMFQTLHDIHPVAESIQGIARQWGTAAGLQHLTVGGRALNRRQYAHRADGYLTSVTDDLPGSRTFDLNASGRVTGVHAEGWTESYDEALRGRTRP